MTLEQAQVVARELKQVGFDTATDYSKNFNTHFVIVALKRNVYNSEVRQELDRLFEGMDFWISAYYGKVAVA